MTDTYTPHQHHGLWSPPSARVLQPPRETMRGIIERTADKHGVTYRDLVGPIRKAPYPAIRFEAAWLCWKTGNWSKSRIGLSFNRDHTWLIYAIARHEQRVGL